MYITIGAIIIITIFVIGIYRYGKTNKRIQVILSEYERLTSAQSTATDLNKAEKELEEFKETDDWEWLKTKVMGLD